MVELLETLKSKYGADVELREGLRSFAKEFEDRDLRAGGFYPDAFTVGGEDVTVAKTTVGKHGAFIVAFAAAGKTWEALVGAAEAAARKAKEDAEAAAKAEAQAAAKAEIDARKARTEPSKFDLTARIANKDGRHYIEAPAGTFVPGDRVTVAHPEGRWAPVECVVTGIGDDYDGKHRGYVMPAKDYDALSEAERNKLPKSAEQAVNARIAANTAEARKPAKMIGGKALKGTARQKEWAEEIRRGVLSKVPEATAQKLLSGEKFQTAKFWIENRVALERGRVGEFL